MNETNLVAILKDIEVLYKANSRNVMSTIITQFVIECCVNPGTVPPIIAIIISLKFQQLPALGGIERTLQHLMVVYAGTVAALHSVIGMEVCM